MPASSRHFFKRRYVCFPVLTGKGNAGFNRHCTGRDTAVIDAITFRVRAGDIKGFYSAMLAKKVRGRTGIEFIGRERILTAFKCEVSLRYKNMFIGRQ